MRNYINLLGSNDHLTENRKSLFLNTNKLPKIISRLSLSNFHKQNNNNPSSNDDTYNMRIINKFNILNKTSGNIGFKGLTFNNGISGLRNTNYKYNNMNNLNSCKVLNSYNEIIKYKISKEQIINLNNKNNNKIIKDISDINNLRNKQFNNTNNNTNKEKKKIYINKNSFNTKTIIHNNNKYHNNMDINQVNNNLLLFKNNNKREKDEIKEKLKEKENDEKNNLCEENNDSFINEFNNLFSNVKENNDSQPHFQGNIEENDKNNDSDDDDKEPDPRINFEQINKVNKSRPQTSYGGLNARRKNLQSAMQNARNSKNRPITSNVP